jgi:hypothetical protein
MMLSMMRAPTHHAGNRKVLHAKERMAKKTLQAAVKKSKAAPCAHTKKRRKRSAHEGKSESDDDEVIEI